MDMQNKSEITANEVAENAKISESKTEKIEGKPDKLTSLKIKMKRCEEAVEKANKKAKNVAALIAAEEKKQHDRDIKSLDSLCGEMHITLNDVTELIRLINEKKLTTEEIKELIGSE